MKKLQTAMLMLVLVFIVQAIKAQANTKNYNLKDFNKVQIENVNGDVEIELGDEYAIIVSGDNNAQEQVQLSRTADDKLLVKLQRKYLEDWKQRKAVKIKIIMPALTNLYNTSNADVSIKNFAGKYIGIENNGNGNVMLVGSLVDFIELKNNGNGNLETKSITSKKVNIFKTGNGDVNIKTDSNFNVEMAGNGDIVNYGKGKAIIQRQSGTGKVVYRNK